LKALKPICSTVPRAAPGGPQPIKWRLSAVAFKSVGRHLREHTITQDERHVLQSIACPL
jgi:hypothetical protein